MIISGLHNRYYIFIFFLELCVYCKGAIIYFVNRKLF